jgi:hypothetical protein
MLLGAEFQVHTDHKFFFNIGDSSQQGLCWISYVDEYGPELHYVEGPRNVIVDTFSRLSRNDESSPLVGKRAAKVISNSESDNDNKSLYSLIIDDKEILNCLLNLPCISSNKKWKKRYVKCRKTHDRRMLYDNTDTSRHHRHQNLGLPNDTSEQCCLNLPEDMVEDNPLDLENIKERQDEDDNLMQSTVRHPTWCSRKTINDVEDILCYTNPGVNAANWRITLPLDLILPTIKWYHQVTGHPGSK